MDATPTTEVQAGIAPTRIPLADVICAATLAGAIAGSALAYSMHVTSFFHVKDVVLAVLLVPLATASAMQHGQSWAGFKAFAPLIGLTLLPFAFSALPNFPHVPAAMHREQARLAVLVLYGILAFGMMRDERMRHFAIDVFLATAGVTAVLAILQRMGLVTFLLPEFDDSPDPLYTVFGNSGLLGGYLAMALPFAIHRALTTRKWALLFLAIAIITPAIALSGSRGSWIAAVVGTLMILPRRELNPRRGAAVLALIVVTTILTFVQFGEAGPGAWVAPEKKDTIRLRFWFWDGAARMAADHPVLGVGLGNYAYWSPRYQGDALRGRFKHLSNEAHTQYAHNEPLHVLAETGLIGVALCAWMLWKLVRCRGPEWGGLAAGCVFGLFHFPLHSAPHALMMILFATMLLARRSETIESNTKMPMSRSALGVVAVASVLLAAFTIWDVLLPSIALREANIHFYDGETDVDLYEKAIRSGRSHAEAHANYANALLQEGDLSKAREQLEIALKGQDTGDLHLGLGYIALQQGDTKVAKEQLEASLHRWPDNETAKTYLEQL